MPVEKSNLAPGNRRVPSQLKPQKGWLGRLVWGEISLCPGEWPGFGGPPPESFCKTRPKMVHFGVRWRKLQDITYKLPSAKIFWPGARVVIFFFHQKRGLWFFFFFAALRQLFNENLLRGRTPRPPIVYNDLCHILVALHHFFRSLNSPTPIPRGR